MVKLQIQSHFSSTIVTVCRGRPSLTQRRSLLHQWMTLLAQLWKLSAGLLKIVGVRIYGTVIMDQCQNETSSQWEGLLLTEFFGPLLCWLWSDGTLPYWSPAHCRWVARGVRARAYQQSWEHPVQPRALQGLPLTSLGSSWSCWSAEISGRCHLQRWFSSQRIQFPNSHSKSTSWQTSHYSNRTTTSVFLPSWRSAMQCSLLSFSAAVNHEVELFQTA